MFSGKKTVVIGIQKNLAIKTDLTLTLFGIGVYYCNEIHASRLG
jgi:hypothetical protein